MSKRERGSLDGYAIATGGTARIRDWESERKRIRSLAQAGVTGWTEYIPSEAGNLKKVRDIVKQGPLFIG